ncbi:MAG: tetraacyldisaccharide 4'-kinase [Saprospirales bacterium]|nr:tetraacyldisaccharide 4'-kinase [Saprospirales bacterium]MBK8489999.1 tetraacyldisaccharide 4'-kinase [Saprospirales bacterium]
MIQSVLVKILLAPFSLLYGLGVSIRNAFYRWGVLREVSFSIPIISVGNLSVGGTGKTPHIEYLIRLLKDYIHVATLSRGYQRKTKGFLVINPTNNAEEAGDEPLMFKRKFQDVLVGVAESRTFGILEILKNQPATQVILLDDAFQHLSVTPGLNILLTEYRNPFTRDYLLPSGRLREWRSAYHRADVMIVSKCPPQMTQEEKYLFIKELNPLPHQRLFFTYYEYSTPYSIYDWRQRSPLNGEPNVLLLSAIAGTEYLSEFLETRTASVRSLEFEDHHYYTNYDVAQMKRIFDNMEEEKKIILTTEKDAVRLELHREFLLENRLPIFILPVRVAFHFGEGPAFNQTVQDFLLNFRT